MVRNMMLLLTQPRSHRPPPKNPMKIRTRCRAGLTDGEIEAIVLG